jgi:hypothetical protein
LVARVVVNNTEIAERTNKFTIREPIKTEQCKWRGKGRTHFTKGEDAPQQASDGPGSHGVRAP